MRILKKMFEAVTASLFAAALVLFVTLFAAAACTSKVTVRFEAMDGTEIGAVTAEAGEELQPPTLPQKEGWVFLGWYLDSECEGEAVELPEVVPASSVTYYARFEEYPAITLDAQGGTSQGRVYAAEGTPLSEALEGVTAEKAGLIFGAWTLAGRELTSSDVVPADGITVQARYKAEYTVEVRKENARGDGYDVERTVYADWEGATVSPEAPTFAHFTLEEELSDFGPLTLAAGENTVVFTYSREKLALSFEANVPAGSVFGGMMAPQEALYEGIETLPDCTFTAEGYAFLGWAEEPSSTDFFEAGEEYRMGGENATLYAVWAKPYEDAHGEGGTLLVAHNAYEDGSCLALVREPARIEGKYEPSGNALTLGSEKGRLEHGHYLLDDSGAYTGYDLAANSVNTALGVLTLDFAAGRASYLKGGSEQTGSYVFVFDEAAGEYLGHYEFYAGSERFSFGLDREKGVFLLEGAEKGEYALYDGGETGDVLSLDGFGKAELSDGQTAGRYRGAGGENEWLVTLGGEEVKVLLALRDVSVGGIVFESEPVALVYRAEYAGTFTSETGTLVLDGYGTATYTTAGGTAEGSFSAAGKLVTFTGEETLRFVLDGSSFTLAGEGAGYFTGEKGTLFLDGAGRAELDDGKNVTEGPYTRLSSGDYAFGELRFMTDGDTYRLFDERLYGVYETLGGGLSLNGYGGGTYLSLTEGSFEVSVNRFGDTFEVWSEEFSTLSGALLFTIDTLNHTVFEVAAAEAGRYALVGTDAAAGVRLDGSGAAELLDEAGNVVASGRYTYDAFTQRGTFALGLEDDFPLAYFRFRLRVGAECVVFSSAAQGNYFGNGASLVLDGYGGGTLTTAAESFYGEVQSIGGGLLLTSGERAYLVTISGGTLLSCEAFTRYTGAEGTLYAGASSALTEEGTLLPFTAAGGGEYLLGTGSSQRRVLLENGRWYVRRDGLQGTVSTAGGTLILDAYGRGSYVTAAGAVSCEVVFAEGNYLEIAAGEETLSVALDGQGGFQIGSVCISFRPLA